MPRDPVSAHQSAVTGLAQPSPSYHPLPAKLTLCQQPPGPPLAGSIPQHSPVGDLTQHLGLVGEGSSPDSCPTTGL